MKQAPILVTILCIAQIGFGRTSSLDSDLKFSYGDSSAASSLHMPSIGEMVSEITRAAGIVADFEIKAAKVLNLQASISRRKKLILYNPEYLTWIHRITDDKWPAYALLAHEIGHHLNGHTKKKNGSRPRLELEADEFAGYVLHKLGASLEQSQEVMLYIARTEATKTHPARAARMQAIQRGWENAAF